MLIFVFAAVAPPRPTRSPCSCWRSRWHPLLRRARVATIIDRRPGQGRARSGASGRRRGVGAVLACAPWANAIGLVVNPTSGKNRGTPSASVAQRLRAAGHEVRRRSPTTTAAARATAPSAPSRRASTCWPVVGGDGMVHLGVNLCADTKTPLAIIAAGTGNDVARGSACRSTTRSRRPTWSAPAIAQHRRRPARQRRGRRRLVRRRPGGRLRLARQRARQHLALAQGQDALQPRDRPRATAVPAHPVCRDGRRRAPRDPRMLVTVGNGPSYGGGMRVCPDAVLDDGLLDVMVLTRSAMRSSSRSSRRSSPARTCPTRQWRCCAEADHARGRRHRRLRRRRALRPAATRPRGGAGRVEGARPRRVA